VGQAIGGSMSKIGSLKDYPLGCRAGIKDQ
jgi:hypothetical protein